MHFLRLSLLVASLLTALTGRCQEHSQRPGIPTAATNRSFSLRLGMRHADALASLKRVGAKPFACSYLIGQSLDRLHPYFTYGWFTLTNGMSVELHGDKPGKDQELLVTYLAVCNSTMLFCCKGETWYTVDAVSLLADRPSIEKSRVVGKEPRPVGPYLLKGMVEAEALKLLVAAGATQAPVSESWLAEMSKTGRWQRFLLKDHRDMELILNFGNENAATSHGLRLILVEATAPKGKDGRAIRYKIECEMVDLDAPLKEGWHWAFGSEWSWKPGEADASPHMRKGGQRR